MKKIFALVLCLLAILQCSPINAAEALGETDVTKEQYILNRLGVVELVGVEDTEREVTRAEFALYINNILKARPNLSKTYFIDVPNSHWAAESINALLERGIISFAADGRFNPDDSISYEQACKILVHTLGYKDYADYEKGGMSEYVKLAVRLGFKINPENNSAITLNEAVNLIYNAMRVDLAYTVKSGENAETVVGKDETLFSAYFDVYTDEGKINAYYGGTVTGDIAEEGEIVINDSTYNLDRDFSADGLIGTFCDIVYTDKNGEKTLLYAKPVNDDFEVITSDTMVGYDSSNMTLSYTKTADSDKIYKKVIPKSDEIIFNGKRFDGDISDKIGELANGGKKGEIKIIPKSNGSSGEVIVIRSYEVFIAGAYSERDNTIYGYYDNTKKYNLSNAQSVIIKNDVGTAANIPSEYPSAMLVSESEDKDFINIIICTSKEQIVIKSVTDNGRTIVTDKDKSVKADESVTRRTNLAAGVGYTVTYDIYGDIIFVSEKSSDDFKIGYLRYISYVEDAFDGSWYIRVYDREKKDFCNYKLADKFIIDNTRYKKDDYKDWLTTIPGNTSLKGKSVIIDRQVIRYRLNSDGEIKEIDTYNCTANEDKENTLAKISGTSDKMYYITTPTSRFGMNVVVNANKTKYLVVPTVNADGTVSVNGEIIDDSPDLYSDTPSLKSWTYYNIEAYKCDSSGLIADIVVINQEPSIEAFDFIMVDELSEGLDKDGMTVKVLSGISNGNKVSFNLTEFCEKRAVALKKGDIIQYSTNAAGDTISAITKVFDYATRTFEPNGSYSDRDRYWYYGNISQSDLQNIWQTPYHQITKGYPYDVKDGVVSVAYTFGDAYKGNTGLVSNIVGSIGVYDSGLDKNDMYIGSANDIITYKNAGTDCDMILMCSRTTNVRQIFIYK